MRYVIGILVLLTVPANAGEVAGRFVFYNHSKYDGFNPSLNAQDDGAIAKDKIALLPGQTASFQNYTTTPSLSGIIVDLTHANEQISLQDFEFTHGNSANPLKPVSPPPLFLIRPGAGTGGSTRIHFLFPRGLIQKEWLRVVVRANAQTGLTQSDTFFFGNAPGDTGNSPTDAVVDERDEVAWKSGISNIAELQQSLVLLDFDRDGSLSERDLLLIRHEAKLKSPPLTLITAPVTSGNTHIDTQFGQSGTLLYSMGDPKQRRTPMDVLPDGSIIIGSSSGRQDADGFILSRYTPDGNLMQDWGEKGSIHANFGPTGGKLTHLLHEDDYLYAFGITNAYGTASLPVIALTAISISTGEVQPTFGRDGVAAANIGNQPLHLSAVTSYLHDGKVKLMVAGTATTAQNKARITLLSFTKEGTIDRDFASVQQELHAIFESGAVPTHIFATPSAIYVLGYGILAKPEPARGMVVMKFSMKGELQLIYPIAKCPGEDGIRRVLGFQVREGKVIAGATCEKSFMLVRYNEAGGVDSHFGNGGMLLTNLGWHKYKSSANTMVFSKNNLFIGGSTHDGKLPHMAVTCLDTNTGSGCRQFGRRGVMVFPFLGPLTSMLELGSGNNLFVGGPTFRSYMDPNRYSRELSIRKIGTE